MSYKCPLCGNNRSENSLFCNSCAKKVQSDYEVELPKDIETADSRILDSRKEDLQAEGLNTDNFEQETEEVVEVVEEEEIKEVGEVVENNYKEKESLNNNDSDYDYSSNNDDSQKNNRRKPLNRFLIILISALILVALFFVYNETIRENNLERSAWETALKENSVEGYLTYIESHPSGIHFDDAQTGLMKLKQDEAIIWGNLKESENISELTGFINQFSNSPYLPLANLRLDSLSWIVALKTNTTQSYSEYLQNAQNGMLRGEYRAEAEKRYNWLYQSSPVNNEEMDSIRTTVNGFYSSLSLINHTGMFQFLSPHVQRFFDSGGASRERIIGELMVTAAQVGRSRINFSPSLEDVKYERMTNGGYEVNVPLVKSYTESGSNILVPGYIAHITMNSDFEIYSIYETKPYYGAP